MRIETDEKYGMPWPSTPRQRAAFVARHETGVERTYHATGCPSGWEIDPADWWYFARGWTTVGLSRVTAPRRRLEARR